MGSRMLRCWATATAPRGTHREGGKGEKLAGVYERMEKQGKEQGDLHPPPSPKKGIPGVNHGPLCQPVGTARGFQHLPLCRRERAARLQSHWGGRGCRVRMAVPLPGVISSKEGTGRQVQEGTKLPPNRD